jgi:hypothetical protein
MMMSIAGLASDAAAEAWIRNLLTMLGLDREA